MSSQLRAAIIEPVGGHGGVAPYDFNLASGLSRNGVDVALYTSDETQPPHDSNFAFRPVYRQVFGEAPVWLRATRYLRGTLCALWSALLEGRTVCHFHFFMVGPLELANVVLARLLARKVVVTAHDVEAFSGVDNTPGLPRLAYGLAHAVVAHNRVSRNELLEKMKLAPKKIHVVPAGNHLDTIPKSPSATEARNRLGLPEQGAILLFIGHIKRMKGLDLLLEAMPAVLEQHPDAILVIAGRMLKMGFDGYQETIDRLGLGPRCITHIRFIPDEELPLYYKASDLVCLPYRKIYQSDVVLMAMSHGRAVVTSDIPGMTEMIEDGQTGFLFRSGEVPDLARAVNEALADATRRERVASGALMLMKDHFNWTRIGQSMAAVYRSL